MTNKFYDQIIDALEARNLWERRQSTFYEMRHDGLRRKSKPYPNAPDLHFPLADSQIDKNKPFYVQQIYATDTLASFVSLRQQDAEATTAVGAWFDYQIKQKSNFGRESMCAIDHMLNSGFDPVKVYWEGDCGDVKKDKDGNPVLDSNDKTTLMGELRYDACDPLHVIVPDWTEELKDADWVVHVMHLSEHQYRCNKNYKQDNDFIKKIKGKPKDDVGDTQKSQISKQREGITYGSEDQIVLWEVYKRDVNTWKITVETISPLLPYGEDEDYENCVRAPFGLPYDHGQFPFVLLRTEIKDKGYYSPRGITEIAAPFESSLCRTWNAKHEWMDFFNRPTFSSDQPIPNAANFRNVPGAILPPGLKPNFNPAPPLSFDEDMQMTRATAEYRIGTPDLGAAEHLAPGVRGGGDKPTATQINAIVGQSSQTTDIRSRICRMDLADWYAMSWKLLLQFKRDDLNYLLQDELKQLDASVLHDEYLIQPNGSADSWNKGQQLQKAVMRFQMFKDDPYIDQGELRISVLELDEPRLVKRLYTDPGIKAQDQAEQQQIEIVQILNNFGCPIHASDDDKVHCAVGIQFFQGRMQEQAPVSSGQAQAFLQHFGLHLQALAQKKDPAAHQVAQSIAPFMQILQQLAQQQPQNVISMQSPGAGPQPNAPALPQGAAAAPSKPSSPEDHAKTGAVILNALSTAIKAGVPISHAEVNPALAAMGLPPLPVTPIAPSPALNSQPQPEPTAAAQ